jgi:hypothetical protein
MPPIACLLFDLGGVLVRNVGFDRLNALLAVPAVPLEVEALKSKLLASPTFRAFEQHFSKSSRLGLRASILARQNFSLNYGRGASLLA